MAPGDVCRGPRCSLAVLGRVVLKYRFCHWSCQSAGSPQRVRPMGCRFFPVPRPPYVCAVSWATWLLFTGVPLGVLRCVCGVLGHLVPVHRCPRSVRCFACAVSLATWLLFTGVPAWFVALRVRCPGPLGSCSTVRALGVLCCVWGVLGHLGPVHWCARPQCNVRLLSSVLVRVRCPGPGGACSPVWALCAVRLCHWWLCPSSSPPDFFSWLLVFFIF